MLAIWPKKIASDHYRLLHQRILTEHLSEEEANQVQLDCPEAANRYGPTCSDTRDGGALPHAGESEALQLHQSGDGERCRREPHGRPLWAPP